MGESRVRICDAMGWQVIDWRDEGEIHIVPTDAAHGRADCWCKPEAEVAKSVTIYTHYAKQ